MLRPQVDLHYRVFMVFMGCQLFLPYTLAAYMVRDFAKGEYSEQTIGQLTGLLAAASSFARSVTAFSWGLLSDKTGRKVSALVLRHQALISFDVAGVLKVLVSHWRLYHDTELWHSSSFWWAM